MEVGNGAYRAGIARVSQVLTVSLAASHTLIRPRQALANSPKRLPIGCCVSALAASTVTLSPPASLELTLPLSFSGAVSRGIGMPGGLRSPLRATACLVYASPLWLGAVTSCAHWVGVTSLSQCPVFLLNGSVHLEKNRPCTFSASSATSQIPGACDWDSVRVVG